MPEPTMDDVRREFALAEGYITVTPLQFDLTDRGPARAYVRQTKVIQSPALRPIGRDPPVESRNPSFVRKCRNAT